MNFGNITVNILGGTVTGGSGLGAGVQFFDGANNTLNNHGTVMALSGTAILGGSGKEIVNNYGTIIGNVDLGAGANAFNNQVGGLFNSGTTVNLGAGNTLTNSGNLSPGGVGITPTTTTLTGNLIQTSTGTYTVDVNWTAPSADLIHVVGGTAQLAGTVVVNPINFPTTAGLHQQFTILHTDAPGDITNNGITPVSTAAVSYLLLFPDLQDMVLDATINFAGVGLGGLNPNQTAIGENLNAIQLAGASPAMSALTTALMTLPTQQSLANALDQLSPEIYNYDLIETLYASQQFSNDMMSCRVAGENGAAFIREGQCIWGRARARFLDFDHTTNNIGADDTTGSFSAGAQVALASDWRLGFAAGYDKIELDTSTGATSDGDRANVGGVLKYNPGPLLLAAGVTAGWGFYDTTRTLSFGGFNAEATSNNDINYVSGQVHAAYLFSQSNWYLKPLVDAGVTELDLDGFTEHGGGGAALIVPGRSDTVFNVSPALEIGTEMRFDNVSVWRPFVRAGATWQDTDSFVLNAGFFDAPQGVSPFTIRTKLDQVLADVGAGVDVINTAGAVLRVQYDGKFAQDTQQNSVSLKGSVPF